MLYDEALFNDEVLNTRRELQESSINLEQLALFCEQSFLSSADQQAVFDQSKGYVVQSLINVTHQLTSLSGSLSNLLEAHHGRLDNISHLVHCVQQDYENIQSYSSKEKIRALGVPITIQRQHKVVQNKSINKDGKKHVRIPIDMSSLDGVGHGVVTVDDTPPSSRDHVLSRDLSSSRDSSILSRESSREALFTRSQYNKAAANGLQPQYRPHDIGYPPLATYNGAPPQLPMDPRMDPRMVDPRLDNRPVMDNSNRSRTMVPSDPHGVATLDRNFDRALTIDRSILYDPRGPPQPHDLRQLDARGQPFDMRSQTLDSRPSMQQHQQGPLYDPRMAQQAHFDPRSQSFTGGVPNNGPFERAQDRSIDRGIDHMSPSMAPVPQYNNWAHQERPGYERSFSQGSGTERSSDDYQPSSILKPRDSPQQRQHQQQPPYSVPYHQLKQPNYNPAKQSYGSRGSLDDSSCTSSSPSINSYKTGKTYDDGSSHLSANGVFSDSGIGTWAQSDAEKLASSDPGYQATGVAVTATNPSTQQLDPDDSAHVPPNFIKRVQALYRYTKASDDELTLPLGAMIYVLQEHSDGWSEGFYDGQYGYFPANFTTDIR